MTSGRLQTTADQINQSNRSETKSNSHSRLQTSLNRAVGRTKSVNLEAIVGGGSVSGSVGVARWPLDCMLDWIPGKATDPLSTPSYISAVVISSTSPSTLLLPAPCPPLRPLSQRPSVYYPLLFELLITLPFSSTAALRLLYHLPPTICTRRTRFSCRQRSCFSQTCSILLVSFIRVHISLPSFLPS